MCTAVVTQAVSNQMPEMSASEGEKLAISALIEALMALPIKERPVIMIVGDDDVTGFTPPAAEPSTASGALRTHNECIAKAEEMERKAQACETSRESAEFQSVARGWRGVASQAAWQDATQQPDRL